MSSSEEYQLAKKRVAAKKGFYGHFGIYLMVIGMLIIINLLNYDGEAWFQYPAMGWGISVAIHYLTVFGLPGLGEDWEEKAIQKEIQKIEKQKYKSNQYTDNELILEDYEKLDLQERVKRPQKRWDDLV